MALLHNSAPISTCAQHSLRETRGSKEATLPSTDFRMQLDLRRGIFFRRSFSGTSGTVPFLVAFHSLYTVVLLIDNCSGSKTEKKNRFPHRTQGLILPRGLGRFYDLMSRQIQCTVLLLSHPRAITRKLFFPLSKAGYLAPYDTERTYFEVQNKGCDIIAYTRYRQG